MITGKIFAKNKNRNRTHGPGSTEGSSVVDVHMVLFVEGRGRRYYPFIDIVEECEEQPLVPMAGYHSSIASDSNC